MLEIIKAQTMEDYFVPEGLEAFVAIDAGTLCGMILFSAQRKNMILSDLKIFKEIDGLVLDDALLRAAASSCRERGLVMMTCSNTSLLDKLDRFGISRKGKKKYTAELDQILKKQCRHGE